MTKKVNYTVELNNMKNDGKTRAQCAGWLAYMGVTTDDAKLLLADVFGNSRGNADHARAVEILIAGKSSGLTNKEIIAQLCDALSWRESTAATLLAYYSYMIEYAKQIANS